MRDPCLNNAAPFQYALASLGNTAFEIGAAVHAFAVTTQDFALEGRVDFSRSTIVNGRESSVLARARDIHAAATAVGGDLVDFGITPAKLLAFKKKIELLSHSRRHGVREAIFS